MPLFMDYIEQIDYVLTILKDNKEKITFDNLHEIVGDRIEKDVLERLIEKLMRDNFVYEKSAGTNGKYAITFEGYMFIGYEKQLKIDRRNALLTNVRAIFLAWGTVLAGIGAVALLVWQIHSYHDNGKTPCDTLRVIQKK
jgi:predicted transcriptional regulator